MAQQSYNPIMAVTLLISLTWSVGITVLAAQDVQKNEMFETINARQQTSWETAKQIWNWAEPGYQETKSSALLIEILRSQGFAVESGVAGIPTAFTATFGKGKPVIGMLGEYDALPGLSQQATPQRAQRQRRSHESMSRQSFRRQESCDLPQLQRRGGATS